MREGLFVISRGIGQVMFQNNAFSGILMLSGILYSSWQLALLAIIGNIISTATAWICSYSREDIKNGLYGFNGTLVGIAIGVFIEITWLSMLLLLITSALSTWITYLFSLQHRLSGYTAPFILSVWILLVGCHWIFPSLLLSTTPVGAEPSSDFLRAFCLNIGQVMFQGNSISGLFFLIAIAVNSRINTFYTALGSILPIVVAVLSGMDHAILNAGLIGYNGVLCAIALGDKTIRSGVWCVCSILISILLQWLGMHWGITTLTAPFVFSVWITIILKRSLEKTV
ncbi:urea transporter [Bacteroides cellulosilyticus]|jgi:urea transporter|uniref:Urea transporter n=1 Tax=Bacteroides cellulosilyticus DSM 14838 TaxID=537012 RepID=E2NCD7_9BACE|nr:urea transporter [Bacteroides cellulosilyticus]EEF90400.1 urea transporter [Bacteroides cellulosilyticus DSM 14838]MBN9708369.1 urea transporter [Bacteroides cellulosilyticus]MDC7303373.1 urea transporter [Bacteroides cellulosilyticus DSM 14838]